MEPEALFTEEEKPLVIELIYDADRSLMRAYDLGEAILGMTTCLRITGRTALFDFEDVYVSPLEEGSVKAVFRYVKRHKNALIVGTVGGAMAQVLGTMILAPFQLIGQYGLAALKQPNAEIIQTVDKKVLEMCMNADYRKSVSKIAMPVNEINQKVTIKVDSKSYEIDCNMQYKFISEEKEPILPELKDGEIVTITGTITRINLEHNDVGIDYHGRKISITPANEDTAVGKAFHQFLETPVVTITGVVVRDNDFVVPKIKVVKMEQYKSAQTNMFDGDASSTSSANKE